MLSFKTPLNLIDYFLEESKKENPSIKKISKFRCCHFSLGENKEYDVTITIYNETNLIYDIFYIENDSIEDLKIEALESLIEMNKNYPINFEGKEYYIRCFTKSARN